MAANLDLFRMHLHRKPNANTKLDLRSPTVDRNKQGRNLMESEAVFTLEWNEGVFV